MALTRLQEWCGRRAFYDGVLVREKKLLLFLDEVVLPQRFVRRQQLSAIQSAARRLEQGRYRLAVKRQRDDQEEKGKQEKDGGRGGGSSSSRRRDGSGAAAATGSRGGWTSIGGRGRGSRPAVGALRTDIM